MRASCVDGVGRTLQQISVRWRDDSIGSGRIQRLHAAANWHRRQTSQRRIVISAPGRAIEDIQDRARADRAKESYRMR